ncbi:MAG: hypothetical protein CME62_10700 [Halobacteriovoraceae bacterium]|nr:hypothetical protein [Halobacteriovoraceae bacterium]|tara:strand:- start:13215 stop:14783 length:1569 start_codon:yes stop_codon:yes gene_type:complete
MYVYISPQVQQKYKSMLGQINSYLEKESVFCIENRDDIAIEDIPVLAILSSEESHDQSHQLSFVIRIEDSNLDLFNSKEEAKSGVIVTNTEQLEREFLNVLALYVPYIRQILNSLFQQSFETLTGARAIRYSKIGEDSWRELAQLEQELYTEAHENFCETLATHDWLRSQDVQVRKFRGQRDPLGAETLYIYDRDEQLLEIVSMKETSVGRVLWLMLYQNHSRFSQLEESRDVKLMFEQLFSEITYPMAYFDEHSHLVISNNSFLKLNLTSSRCEEYATLPQFELEQKLYKCVKISDQAMSLYLLLPLTNFLQNNKKPSGHELGIISSSIAHEINNPLAGILAALDYLLLDCENDEVRAEFLEMKKGVFRCKKLVDLFLGFSNLKKDQQTSLVDPAESLMQAIEMTRFRLVENNLNLKVVNIGNKNFKVKMNHNIFTMINYLVLGELLTYISHHKLIQGSSLSQFEIQMESRSGELVLQFPFEVEFLQKTLDSKLVKHLMGISQLSLKIQKKYLTFLFTNDQ